MGTRYGRHVHQDLANFSGQEVGGLRIGKLASRYKKAAEERKALEAANASEFRLNIPHIRQVQQRIAEELEAEASEMNGNLPVAAVYDAVQIVKARKDSDSDAGLRALRGHLEKIWKRDRGASITAASYLKLHDHYRRNFPKSAAADVITEIGNKGYATLPVSDLQHIASTIQTQDDYNDAMVRHGLSGPQPHQVKARQYVLALVNGEEVDDANYELMRIGSDDADWYGEGGEKFEPSSTQQQAYDALMSAAERINRGEYESKQKSRGKYTPTAEADFLIEAAEEVLRGIMDPEEAMNLISNPLISQEILKHPRKENSRSFGSGRRQAQADDELMLSSGFDAGNYASAYEGGDWESSLEAEENAGNQAFDAAYVLAFIPGSTDSWMWDDDYMDAWDRYGKKMQAQGIAVDDPYEAQTEQLEEEASGFWGRGGKRHAQSSLDDFTEAYIEAAFWSSTDESDESGGEPMDANYGPEDLDDQSMQEIIQDCQEFQQENAEDLAEFYEVLPPSEWSPEAQAGHDFWLTRNGHGAGFWDRDVGDVGERLSDAARQFGEAYLWVGDGRVDYDSSSIINQRIKDQEGREDHPKEGSRPFGSSRHSAQEVGALALAKAAVSEVYDGLYSCNFLKDNEEGAQEFECKLHSPDGQKVWATVGPDSVVVFSRTHTGDPDEDIVPIDENLMEKAQRRFSRKHAQSNVDYGESREGSRSFGSMRRHAQVNVSEEEVENLLEGNDELILAALDHGSHYWDPPSAAAQYILKQMGHVSTQFGKEVLDPFITPEDIEMVTGVLSRHQDMVLYRKRQKEQEEEEAYWKSQAGRQAQDDGAAAQSTLKEMMDRYEEYHEKWIAEHGSDQYFDEWFTSQVLDPASSKSGGPVTGRRQGEMGDGPAWDEELPSFFVALTEDGKWLLFAHANQLNSPTSESAESKDAAYALANTYGISLPLPVWIAEEGKMLGSGDWESMHPEEEGSKKFMPDVEASRNAQAGAGAVEQLENILKSISIDEVEVSDPIDPSRIEDTIHVGIAWTHGGYVGGEGVLYITDGSRSEDEALQGADEIWTENIYNNKEFMQDAEDYARGEAGDDVPEEKLRDLADSYISDMADGAVISLSVGDFLDILEELETGSPDLVNMIRDAAQFDEYEDEDEDEDDEDRVGFYEWDEAGDFKDRPGHPMNPNKKE